MASASSLQDESSRVDPASVASCEKVDCDTPLEAWLTGLGYAAGFLGASLILRGIFGSTRYYAAPPSRSVLFAGLVVLAVAAFFLIARLFVDDYYLIDSAQHRVIMHSRVLFWRRLRVIATRDEILGIGTDSMYRNRYQRSWMRTPYLVSHVVLVKKDGGQVALTDWVRDSTWTSNNNAIAWAAKLGCAAEPAPEQTTLVVSNKSGVPAISYKPI